MLRLPWLPSWDEFPRAHRRSVIPLPASGGESEDVRPGPSDDEDGPTLRNKAAPLGPVRHCREVWRYPHIRADPGMTEGDGGAGAPPCPDSSIASHTVISTRPFNEGLAGRVRDDRGSRLAARTGVRPDVGPDHHFRVTNRRAAAGLRRLRPRSCRACRQEGRIASPTTGHPWRSLRPYPCRSRSGRAAPGGAGPWPRGGRERGSNLGRGSSPWPEPSRSTPSPYPGSRRSSPT